MSNWLDIIAGWVWSASWHAAAIVAVIVLLRAVAGRRLSPTWRCALWSLVAVRLLLPAAPRGSWSLFSFAERWGIQTSTHNELSAGAAPQRTEDPSIVIGYGTTPLSAADLKSAADTATPTPASLKPNRPFPFVAVWLTGVFAFLAHIAIGQLLLNRRISRRRAIADQGIVALFDHCRVQMNVRRRIELACTDGVNSPALTGIWRPAILLPTGLAERLSRDELRFVFLHELAHVRRWDVLVEWGIACLTAVHWFNPLVWLAAHLYRTDRELARDAMVLRAAGTDERASYGGTILRLIESFRGQAAGAGLVGMLDGKRRLRERIRMISRFECGRRRWGVGGIAGLVLFCIVGCAALTDPKRPAAAPTSSTEKQRADDGPADEVITRVYDVRDLVVAIPDFNSEVDFPSVPRGPSTQKTKPAEHATTTPSRAELAAMIIDLIRGTIDPDSWSVHGPGLIRELSGQLIITQRRSNQEQILAILKQLRQSRAIQMMVETRFVVLDRELLKTLPASLRDHVAGAFEQSKSAAVYLDDQEVQQLLAAMQRNPRSQILTSPRLTLFNGQRAYVLVSTQTAYVADLTVVRNKKDNSVSYDPVIDTVDSGVIVDVQGTVSSDRRYVTLTLRPRLMVLQRIERVPFDNVPDDQRSVEPKPTVQRPVVSVRQLKTTVSVPDGGTLLLGGQALAPEGLNPKEQKDLKTPFLSDIPHLGRLFNNQAPADPQATLLILVKPRIIIQSEVPEHPPLPGVPAGR
jgi:beta-lactamase regulating signal transducer with metallopeptidase domain